MAEETGSTPCSEEKSVERSSDTLDGQSATGSKLRPVKGEVCWRSPSNEIVKSLMSFNVSDDKEFSRKALMSLVKKLKERPDDLDAFLGSIYSRGDDSKKCVTIARSKDGRLQIAERKNFPHVVYVSIFRWSNVGKGELEALPHCEHGYEVKDIQSVCINPYHYKRIETVRQLLMDKKDCKRVKRNNLGRMHQRAIFPLASTATGSLLHGIPMVRRGMSHGSVTDFSGAPFSNVNDKTVHPQRRPVLDLRPRLEQKPRTFPQLPEMAQSLKGYRMQYSDPEIVPPTMAASLYVSSLLLSLNKASTLMQSSVPAIPAKDVATKKQKKEDSSGMWNTKQNIIDT